MSDMSGCGARNFTQSMKKHLKDEMAIIVAWCHDELQSINPNFLLNMVVIELSRWFCHGIACGFGREGVPIINFAEHTYCRVGYDPKWLYSITDAYRKWGARVLQASAKGGVGCVFPANWAKVFGSTLLQLNMPFNSKSIDDG